MPKFFVNKEQVTDEKIFIKNEDVNHIKNVLRAKVGENIEICNKDEQRTFLCEIAKISENEIECNIINEIEKKVEPNFKITIFQGLPKSEKMELIIQKSVELGAFEIVPVAMQRCVVKLKDKNEEKKIQRWNKQSESAAKQCGRNYIPIVSNVWTIQDICLNSKDYDFLIVANANEKMTSLKQVISNIKLLNKDNLKIGIIIGPEGGFSEDELVMLNKSNVISVSLGNRILRTETVALNVLSILMYELE